MPEPTSGTPGGDRRDDERRAAERRGASRRTPPPPWRRPWAYVGYGIAGALLVVVLMRTFDDDDEPEISAEDLGTAAVAPAVDSTLSPAASTPPREAMGTGEYERLLAQGEAAVGQRVVTLLFCEQVNSIGMKKEAIVTPSVAALADANGRVAGAECKWGDSPDAQDVLLLVPAGLAPRFAAAPEVQQGFIRRRRVRAELEWIGRSEALDLRNVGVLRAVR